MSEASKITLSDAEAIFEDNDHEAQGTVTISGEDFDWWTDGRRLVWFYEPGADGEDTIKRFQTDMDLYEVPSAVIGVPTLPLDGVPTPGVS